MSAAPAPLGLGASLPRATPSWLHFGAGEMFPRVSPAHLGSGTCRSLRCSPCVPSSVGANTTTTPGRALVAPTFLALKTGREQAALLFSVDGAGTGPSGCSRDPAAARGGRDAAPRAQRAASLHPCPGPILSFGGRAPAQGCRQTLPYLTRQQGRVDPSMGQPSGEAPAAPGMAHVPGEFSEFGRAAGWWDTCPLPPASGGTQLKHQRARNAVPAWSHPPNLARAPPMAAPEPWGCSQGEEGGGLAVYGHHTGKNRAGKWGYPRT